MNFHSKKKKKSDEFWKLCCNYFGFCFPSELDLLHGIKGGPVILVASLSFSYSFFFLAKLFENIDFTIVTQYVYLVEGHYHPVSWANRI